MPLRVLAPAAGANAVAVQQGAADKEQYMYRPAAKLLMDIGMELVTECVYGRIISLSMEANADDCERVNKDFKVKKLQSISFLY